jgi:hypothetical protein
MSTRKGGKLNGNAPDAACSAGDEHSTVKKQPVHLQGTPCGQGSDRKGRRMSVADICRDGSQPVCRYRD